DFVHRVDSRVVNRKALESLVKAGAFDQLESRDRLLHNLDVVVGFSSRLHKQKENGQTDLFGGQVDELSAELKLDEPPSSTPEREQLQWERELLGVYLSNHPLEAYRPYLREKTAPLADIKTGHDGVSVAVGGLIGAIREITTKNGQRMAFVTIEDFTSELELIIFPNVFESTRDQLDKDVAVFVEGKVSTKDRDGRQGQDIKILVDDIRRLTPADLDSFQETGQAYSIDTARSSPGSRGKSRRQATPQQPNPVAKTSTSS